MSLIGIKNPFVVIFVVAVGAFVSGKLDAIMGVVTGSWMIVGHSVSMSERAGDKLKLLVNFENRGVLPPTAERVDCCRCVGGADELLELP